MLIVLGMLAFMVISATAFSIYMRQHRLPSSFLRERISASFLVKGALAEAMSELDSALGADFAPNEYSPQTGYFIENPHQGLHNGQIVRNYWRNRVYMRNEPINGIDENETSSSTFLEGLAYLPPPLVNTFRYWSRRSPTARWNYLPYDTGRYVFTAINVTDYLDVNRLNANAMRDSSPTNRITITYRFEDAAHQSSGAAKATTFDTWIRTQRDSAFGPLVSMADYNMALRAGGPFASVFCDYIENAAQLRPFYGGNRETARQQTFVTDSWHPHFATNANEIALSDFVDPDGFFTLGGGTADDLGSLTKAGDGNTPFGRLQRRLTFVELAALHDYLDEDDVPISLALPTIERTPQLTGLQVQPKSPVKIKFTHKKTEESKEANKIIHHAWSFDSIDGSFRIDLTGVFPFKRSSGVNPADCSVEVLLKGFLTDSPGSFASFRTKAEGLRPTAEEWGGKTKHRFATEGVFTAHGKTSFSPANVQPQKPADTLINQHLSVDVEVQAEKDGPCVFAFQIEEKTDKNGNVVTKSDPMDDEAGMGSPFAYLDESGKPTTVPTLSVSKAGKELSLVVLAWARLVDGNGKTVDLAPATLQDDTDLNGMEVKLPDSFKINLCGERMPVFSVPSGAQPFGTLSLSTFAEKGDDVTFSGEQGSLALFCNDPRYNFAPEDWYEVSSADAGIQASTWLANVKGPTGDDIFQFVSNAGYLQSIGELQFLPRVDDFSGMNDIDPIHGLYYDDSKYDGNRHTRDNLANARFMWKTHWAFFRVGQDKDEMERDVRNMSLWNIVDSRGGVTMTPYAAKLDLFMAGLANTPYDWAVADPLNEYKASDIDTYSFNSRNAEARIPWEDLEDVAERMRQNYRELANHPGSEQYQYENWDDWGSAKFFGILGPDDGIHDVDRKFLFSYWKNCYATNQQLFLIFVRAEPTMMMGNGSNDHTPAQLGGRAVALVWREPVSSISGASGSSGANARPHRMRILFYHQFE